LSSTLIRNASILTMNDGMEVLSGAVSIRDGRIAAVGTEPAVPHDTTIDAGGAYLLPGFVQTHVHLCQTLFRGYADDLVLLEWLRTRIWPMEAAHTPSSLRAAARLACLELLRSGTTTVLTMETVHDTDAVIEAVSETGLRATIAKSMMDETTPDAPARLREPGRRSLDDSLALYARYHGTANGRIRVALGPRFALSCSRSLLEATAGASARDGMIVHTHAAEQQEEIALVRQVTGRSNVEYFEDVGLMSPRLNVAHCVWVTGREQEGIAARGVKVTHCPGSNLKLGSGIAPIHEMRALGINVSLGSDGAACNNHLDMFGEMRLAATLQAVRSRPGAITARDALWMATRGGAIALGLDADIGSVEQGKRADLILVAAGGPHLVPSRDPFSTLVYAAQPSDVRLTMVDGVVAVRDGHAEALDSAEIAATARAEARALAGRAGL
jgi:cytosine/adenosine deaminase-related metal-dependent hydrolase